MTPEIRAQLLASMHANRLVVVCGAGLSMAAPSSLPSAWRVAESCFDNYKMNVDPGVDPSLRHDLEALAQHFADTNTLQSVFIERLVPWSQFVRPPNAGHAAIADFLTTKSAIAALSANYDTLIERCAVDNGFDFQASLDGVEATVRAATQGPLLKFHGCAIKDRPATVWAPTQLNEPPIADRIERSKEWMAANLRQKDLLVVGFWSDWDYLNEILDNVLGDIAPLSVTVFDPAPVNDLEEKAPFLWGIANGEGVNFLHVQQSGAEALDELRNAFSAKFLRLVLASGRETYEEVSGQAFENALLEMEEFNSEILYGLRRDAEGVPIGQPATLSSPLNCEILGAFHLLLRKAGAIQTALGYDLNGRSIRVINGSGVALSKLKARFTEAPSLETADIVAAPGATDYALPANVVREGKAGDIVRPAPSGRWLDFERARAELGI